MSKKSYSKSLILKSFQLEILKYCLLQSPLFLLVLNLSSRFYLKKDINLQNLYSLDNFRCISSFPITLFVISYLLLQIEYLYFPVLQIQKKNSPSLLDALNYISNLWFSKLPSFL